VLETRGVYKAFPGVLALENVDFEVYAGEIHALVGENGAGKSTLMKALAGIHSVSQGEILLDGQPVRFRSPAQSRAAGISLIYQEPNLVPNLSVAENIFLGSEPRLAGWLLHETQMNQAALGILEQLGSDLDPNRKVAQLSVGEGQLVEIARALAHRGRVLVMDEPTAALSERETERLLEVICGLRREGVAIVYISHRINEVYALADRVTVLRDGERVGTLTGDAIRPAVVVKMMAGEPNHDTRAAPTLDGFAPTKPPHAKPWQEPAPMKIAGPQQQQRKATERPILEVRDLTDGRKLRPISLRVAAGEILGLSGLVGSGRSTLVRLICGADPKSAGEVLLNGQVQLIRSPADALRAGIAYLPENRAEQGLFPEMSALDNLVIGVLGRHTHGGISDEKALRSVFQTAVERLGIGVHSAHAKVATLSGGNQQKLLFARSLVAQPKVLILDEATRGVDVNSRAELHALIRDAAAAGTAIIMISTELPEITQLCHRALVLLEGELVAELTGEELTQDNILAFATGLKRGRNES
jgi:ribose transport system ATP-binding protein